MGLFREAGRQVEQLKQNVTGGDEDGEDAQTDDAVDADYECASCGARFDAHDGECPECWSEAISETPE